MKQLFTFFLLISVAITIAQESSEEITEASTNKSITISGSIDAYYRANITAPNDENAIAPASSFANLPGFSLGMANIIFGYEGEKVGFVADLVFGPRGTDAIFASPMYSATGNIVNQLYAYWNISDYLTLTMGNFNTFLGYEVISPTANFNYSTSYLFSYGPFSHTGLKADITLSNDVSLMLGVFNDTDLTEFNPTGNYAFGAQLGYKNQYLNLLLDPSFTEIDFTGGVDISDTFFLGLNAAYLDVENSGSFAGVALYPQITTSEAFTIGLRGEYFLETELGVGAIGSYDNKGDASVFAITLTGSYQIDNLIIKPEIRLDSASENGAFIDNDLAAAKSLGSFVLAAIYAF